MTCLCRWTGSEWRLDSWRRYGGGMDMLNQDGSVPGIVDRVPPRNAENPNSREIQAPIELRVVGTNLKKHR